MIRHRGFTLIELLVVVSIMAIVAIIVIVSFGSFKEDANLKNETFNIQSYLRLAQSNAQAGVKCTDPIGVEKGGMDWSIKFIDRVGVILDCSANSAPQRTWLLNHPADIYEIDGISGVSTCHSSFASDTATIGAENVITLKFAYLSGKVSFKDAQEEINDCLKNSGSVVIRLRKRFDSEDFKTVTINHGGSIDVE